MFHFLIFAHRWAGNQKVPDLRGNFHFKGYEMLLRIHLSYFAEAGGWIHPFADDDGWLFIMCGQAATFSPGLASKPGTRCSWVYSRTAGPPFSQLESTLLALMQDEFQSAHSDLRCSGLQWRQHTAHTATVFNTLVAEHSHGKYPCLMFKWVTFPWLC